MIPGDTMAAAWQRKRFGRVAVCFLQFRTVSKRNDLKKQKELQPMLRRKCQNVQLLYLIKKSCFKVIVLNSTFQKLRGRAARVGHDVMILGSMGPMTGSR